MLQPPSRNAGKSLASRLPPPRVLQAFGNIPPSPCPNVAKPAYLQRRDHRVPHAALAPHPFRLLPTKTLSHSGWSEEAGNPAADLIPNYRDDCRDACLSAFHLLG
jgi:hypothetical protein